MNELASLQRPAADHLEQMSAVATLLHAAGHAEIMYLRRMGGAGGVWACGVVEGGVKGSKEEEPAEV